MARNGKRIKGFFLRWQVCGKGKVEVFHIMLREVYSRDPCTGIVGLLLGRGGNATESLGQACYSAAVKNVN